MKYYLCPVIVATYAYSFHTLNIRVPLGQGLYKNEILQKVRSFSKKEKLSFR